MNPLILLAVAAGAGFYLLNKVQNVSVLAKAFEYKYTVKNFRFQTWKEIRFSIEITIMNPSNIGITITKPFVQVFYNKSLLTSSVYNIPSLVIQPQAQSVLPAFEFSIDLLSNWFTIKSMLSTVLKGVSFTNLQAKEIVIKNQAAFLKLLNVQFTGYMNNTPFTKSFNLG